MPANPSQDVEPSATIATRSREFAKEFVARQIEEAAISLFAERGYENVTVADIADAIGVSRRTFFRYFASKDEVLRAHAIRLHARVLRALERRPPDEPAAVALCNAFLDTADVSAEERENMLRRNRVLRDHQGQAGWATMTPEMGAALVDRLAARMRVEAKTDLRPRLLVATIWAAADAATAHWVAAGDDEPLTITMRYAFDKVMSGLSALDSD
ncbi:TetR family transcriptional regulator [Mycobacterium colombiense]